MCNCHTVLPKRGGWHVETWFWWLISASEILSFNEQCDAMRCDGDMGESPVSGQSVASQCSVLSASQVESVAEGWDKLGMTNAVG